MSLPGRLLSIDGQRVFCHRSGPRGQLPIVFVHGFLVGHWVWRHVLPPLVEAGRDVIAFDLPGTGESDRPPPTEYGYDAPAFAQTLMGVLGALDIPRCVLVGHSLGAGVSAFAATQHADRVERLVLIDPLVYKFSVPVEARLVLTPVVGLPLMRTLYNRWAIRRYMTRVIYRDPDLASPEWVDYLYERMKRPGGIEAVHATMQFGCNPVAVEHAVRAVRAPTLIVWGEEDKLFPSAWAQRLAHEIEDAEVEIIPACGHSPPEERPDALVPLLEKFLARDITPRRALG